MLEDCQQGWVDEAKAEKGSGGTQGSASKTDTSSTSAE